jgi:6,7-dimethyl-8-ribityllumazine synthase
MKNILIVCANFYDDISKDLVLGAALELCKISGDKRTSLDILHDVLHGKVANFTDEDITKVLVYVSKTTGFSVDVKYLLGAMEIPITIKLNKSKYDAFVALGCVIRGETSHYDYVCSEVNRGITILSLEHDVKIGNGILTVENYYQAKKRSGFYFAKDLNKGGFATSAVLSI